MFPVRGFFALDGKVSVFTPTTIKILRAGTLADHGLQALTNRAQYHHCLPGSPRVRNGRAPCRLARRSVLIPKQRIAYLL